MNASSNPKLPVQPGKPRTNYIFVDYENRQDVNLDLIADKPVKVFIVSGPRQTTMPRTLTKQIQKYHDQVVMLESESPAKNALDLVLAYHVGCEAKVDPDGYFHIVAKDKDYDALVKHLRVLDVRITRDEEFAKVSVFVDVLTMSLDQRADFVWERMGKNKDSQPGKKKTLLSAIRSICKKKLQETEVEQILERLIARKKIVVSGAGAVNYNF